MYTNNQCIPGSGRYIEGVHFCGMNSGEGGTLAERVSGGFVVVFPLPCPPTRVAPLFLLSLLLYHMPLKPFLTHQASESKVHLEGEV